MTGSKIIRGKFYGSESNTGAILAIILKKVGFSNKIYFLGETMS